ncbi:hypothetical protein BX600DRAFT_431831 [Xylariales sp. PMI_506]|nr:hypothetical protein BX600DRAFT_431831 [Xylariales sp. PMI_506]
MAPTPASHAFVAGLPKVDLHIHLEGSISPALRWRLAERNGIPQGSSSLEQMTQEYLHAFNGIMSKTIEMEAAGQAFFDHFLGGINALRQEDDFYEVGRAYFETCAKLNIRHSELSLDFQEYQEQVSLITALKGYQRAQREAEKKFDITSILVLSFTRSKGPAEAMKAYEHALQYREMFGGFGVAGNSDGTSLMSFNEVLTRAKQDGFYLTAHCDAKHPNMKEFMHDYVTVLGGQGLDRLDHGVDVASDPEIIDICKRRGVGVTICPWMMYAVFSLLYDDADQILFEETIRKLYDEGVYMSIGSDDPALAGDRWLSDNFTLVADQGGFTEEELVNMSLSSVHASWTTPSVKSKLEKEILRYAAAAHGHELKTSI